MNQWWCGAETRVWRCVCMGLMACTLSSAAGGCSKRISPAEIPHHRADANLDAALDGASIPLAPVQEEETCHQVDLLFIVDNSSSMGRYQAALADAFPGFVELMYEHLPQGTSIHVGITTTSFSTDRCEESTSACVTESRGEQPGGCYEIPPDDGNGPNGYQGRLFSHEGLSWFAANTADPDSGPLQRWFVGAATEAGENGSNIEVPSAAASYAFDPLNQGSNSGFLRDDDTVLLLFFLTDEPDKSPEELEVYIERVVAAKSACGGATCVRTAGLIHPCIQSVDNVLWRFMNGFEGAPTVGNIRDVDSYIETVGAALANELGRACGEVGLI